MMNDGPIWITAEQALQRFDERCREELGISGEEFAKQLDAGTVEDTSVNMRIAMLRPRRAVEGTKVENESDLMAAIEAMKKEIGKLEAKVAELESAPMAEEDDDAVESERTLVIIIDLDYDTKSRHEELVDYIIEKVAHIEGDFCISDYWWGDFKWDIDYEQGELDYPRTITLDPPMVN